MSATTTSARVRGGAGLCLLSASVLAASLSSDLLARPLLAAALFAASLAGAALLWSRAAALAGSGVVMCALIALRGIALFGGPTLSDDAHRYVHEGRAQRLGLAVPYQTPPAAVTPPPDDGTTAKVNHNDVPAAYPPGVELVLFATVLVGDAIGAPLVPLRLALVFADLFVLALLFRRRKDTRSSAGAWILYGAHPLPLFETAMAGHLDGLGVAALLVAVASSRPMLSGALIGLASHVKPVAAVALFAMRGGLEGAQQRRRRAHAALLISGFVVAVALPALPYAAAGAPLGAGLVEYATRWRASPFLYAIVEAPLVPIFEARAARGVYTHVETPLTRPILVDAALLARLICGAVAMGAVVLIGRASSMTAEARVGAMLCAVWLCAPAVHPWYLVWIVPFAALSSSRALLWFSAAAPLLYQPVFGFACTGEWSESAWPRIAVAAALLAGLVVGRAPALLRPLRARRAALTRPRSRRQQQLSVAAARRPARVVGTTALAVEAAEPRDKRRQREREERRARDRGQDRRRRAQQAGDCDRGLHGERDERDQLEGGADLKARRAGVLVGRRSQSRRADRHSASRADLKARRAGVLVGRAAHAALGRAQEAPLSDAEEPGGHRDRAVRGHRDREREPEARVDERRAEPAAATAQRPHRRGEEQRRRDGAGVARGRDQQRDEQREHEPLRELPREVDLAPDPDAGRGPDLKRARAQRLRGALLPAVLLHTPRRGALGELRRRADVVDVAEATPGEARAHGEIEIFGHRRRAPPARARDRRPPPDPRGAVEAEEHVAGVAAGLLDGEVHVEERRLRARERRSIAVEVIPPRLHEIDVVVEGRERAAEEVGRGDEVGVEVGDELALREREAVGERAGLEAVARRPPHVDHVDAAGAPALDRGGGEGGRRAVVAVVEDLDLLERGGPVERARGVDRALADGGLVVERDLDGDVGCADVGRAIGRRGVPRRRPARERRERSVVLVDVDRARASPTLIKWIRIHLASAAPERVLVDDDRARASPALIEWIRIHLASAAPERVLVDDDRARASPAVIKWIRIRLASAAPERVLVDDDRARASPAVGEGERKRDDPRQREESEEDRDRRHADAAVVAIKFARSGAESTPAMIKAEIFARSGAKSTPAMLIKAEIFARSGAKSTPAMLIKAEIFARSGAKSTPAMLIKAEIFARSGAKSTPAMLIKAESFARSGAKSTPAMLIKAGSFP